ncbi:hypothetical protein JTE88_07135 [Arcanobacterium phocisimile]|uniref:Alpha/beta hydrolase family protein n=1 Tax=Arcanobacterium phocisimile TaxID=1302235 RepID=A0ABX7IG71_9ACTO|nr:hypothetical protein [Arcanobacterium phocisimile]QRV01855.1 hypothetical protein JTE88_07135 [Arcanobacterium phocisimile]
MKIGDRATDYFWFLRTLLNRQPALENSNEGAAIVVVPGIYEGPTQLDPLARSLHRAGYRIERIPELAFLTRPTSELADIVTNKVASIAGPVVLLAHSKGGLVGGAAMASQPSLPHLAGMIAIATPWQGSSLAQFFPPRTPVRRLAPRGLDLGSTQLLGTHAHRIYSLIPRWDPHVPNGSYLDGGHNIRLSTAGHFYPLGTAETQRYVHECVRRLLRKHAEDSTTAA